MYFYPPLHTSHSHCELFFLLVNLIIIVLESLHNSYPSYRFVQVSRHLPRKWSFFNFISESETRMPTITLQSNDGQEFTVDTTVAKCSLLIRRMLEDLGEEEGNDETLSVSEVDGETLGNILQWAEHHHNQKIQNGQNVYGNQDEIGGNEVAGKWDASIMERWDDETLSKVMTAANFLAIRDLMDQTSSIVFEKLVGKSTEELQAMLKLNYDGREDAEPMMLCEENVSYAYVVLKSSDGLKYCVNTEIARLIPIINTMYNETGLRTGEIIPFDHYSSILQNIIAWLKHHKDDPLVAAEAGDKKNDEVDEWDAKFLEALDHGELLELMLVADKLEIRGLKKFLTKRFCSLATGMSLHEWQKVFG